MNRTLVRTLLSIGLLATFPASAGHAGPTSSPGQDAPVRVADPNAGSIDFVFEGGSASALFSQLALAFPDFPVLVDQDARRFEIPGFEARITKPYTIVELVCGVPGELLKASPEDQPVRGSLDARVVGRELTQIRFEPSGTPLGGFSRMTVEVLSIQELLTSGMDIEAIFATVEAGIALESGEAAASLRFHEATGILFVKGSPAVNRTVTETIKALTISAKWLVSDEALAAKKARIQSEAMSITEEAVKMEQAKLEQLKETQEALLQKDRERRERKDAERRNAVESKGAD